MEKEEREVSRGRKFVLKNSSLENNNSAIPGEKSTSIGEVLKEEILSYLCQKSQAKKKGAGGLVLKKGGRGGGENQKEILPRAK